MSDKTTVASWLKQMADSVKKRDLAAHMKLVSKNVHVYGVPGKEVIDYAGWKERRKNEFSKGLLESISYSEPRLKIIALRRIAFSVEETMRAHNGDAVMIHKDVVLEQEHDARWRVVEERVKDYRLEQAP